MPSSVPSGVEAPCTVQGGSMLDVETRAPEAAVLKRVRGNLGIGDITGAFNAALNSSKATKENYPTTCSRLKAMSTPHHEPTFVVDGQPPPLWPLAYPSTDYDEEQDLFTLNQFYKCIRSMKPTGPSGLL